MWIVAQFAEEDTIEAIPSTWFLENKSCCLWPPTESCGKLESAITKKITPEKNWIICEIRRIFAEAETYAIALEKLEIAQNNSDVEDMYIEMLDKNKRSDRHKVKMNSSDENEINENIHMETQHFPTVPEDIIFEFTNGNNSNGLSNRKTIKSSLKQKIKLEDSQRLKTGTEFMHWKKSRVLPNDFDVENELSDINDENQCSNIYSRTKLCDSDNKLTNKEINCIPTEELTLAKTFESTGNWWIVQFEINNCIRIIPASWMAEDRKSSYYHPYIDQKRGIQAVIKREKPGENWTQFNLSNILDSAETYAQAAEKSSHFYEDSVTAHSEKENFSSNLEEESHNAMASMQMQKLDVKTQPSSFKKSKVLPVSEIKNMSTDEKLLYNLEMSYEILRNQAELKVAYGSGSHMSSSSEESKDFWEMRKIFPFTEVTKFKNFNKDLQNKDVSVKVRRFLESIGGRDGCKGVRRMLQEIMSDEVAVHYSFCGRRLKNSFHDHRVWKIILNVAVNKFKHFTLHLAESSVKDWLKQATRRVQRATAKKDNKKKNKKDIQGDTRNNRNKEKQSNGDLDSDSADLESDC